MECYISSHKLNVYLHIIDIITNFIIILCQFAHLYKFAQLCPRHLWLKNTITRIPPIYFLHMTQLFYTVLDCKDCSLFHVCPCSVKKFIVFPLAKIPQFIKNFSPTCSVTTITVTAVFVYIYFAVY